MKSMRVPNKAHTQLALDYTYNDENHPTNLYKRSDHCEFCKEYIPIIFYFDGIHEDYHNQVMKSARSILICLQNARSWYSILHGNSRIATNGS